MPFPPVAVVHPISSLSIRVENQRPANTVVVEVEVRDLKRGEYQDVPWSEIDDQTQLMKADVAATPLAEGDDETNSVIAVISVGYCGDTEVDDDARKGEYGGMGIERKDLAVQTQFVVFIREL